MKKFIPYKGQLISATKETALLKAIKQLCSSADNINSNQSICDDGEWNYKIGKAFLEIGADISKLKNLSIDAELHNYQGVLTIEKLLEAFEDFYDLLTGYFDPIDEVWAEFMFAYEYLKLKQSRGEKISIWDSEHWNNVHPSILSIAKYRYSTHLYADCTEAVFKEVIKRVKDYVNPKILPLKLDGDKLMNRAFGCENQEPIIKFNDCITQEEIDEQRGIMSLFKGIVGIRNRKAHENVILNDKDRAMEYIYLSSLLMRLLDEYAK